VKSTPPAIDSAKNHAQRRNEVTFKDEYDFDLLENQIENIVIKELEKQLALSENRDVCKCRDCVIDMAALALNHLKPAYRSSLSMKGYLYKQNLHAGNKDQAYARVIKDAILKIAENPSH